MGATAGALGVVVVLVGGSGCTLDRVPTSEGKPLPPAVACSHP